MIAINKSRNNALKGHLQRGGLLVASNNDDEIELHWSDLLKSFVLCKNGEAIKEGKQFSRMNDLFNLKAELNEMEIEFC